jgi:hypothetical protein
MSSLVEDYFKRHPAIQLQHSGHGSVDARSNLPQLPEVLEGMTRSWCLRLRSSPGGARGPGEAAGLGSRPATAVATWRVGAQTAGRPGGLALLR